MHIELEANRHGEFGESQVGPSHLKARLDRHEGVKGLAEMRVCLRQRAAHLGNTA